VSFAHHLALVVSIAALAAAGARCASALAPAGLERFVAAVVLAAAAAAIEAMALGLAGAGASPIALTAAALATWLAVRALVPAPVRGVRAEAAAAWAAAPRGPRMALGGLAGLAVAWVAWNFRYPLIGEDGLKYHWAIVVAWVHGGSPGAATPIDASIPFEAYPLTNEVLLTWGAGISRSWAAATLWTPATLLLCGAGAWLALARLRAGALVAGLGAAVLVSLPLCVVQLNGPPNDVPALAWLVCTVALCVVAVQDRRPALLAAALAAAGLAIGTKTTTAPLALCALAVAGWRLRGALGPCARLLAGGAVAGLAVSAPWYLRNLIDHGSPLWPFASGPFGDDVPSLYARLDSTFLSHPRTMLGGRTTDYARVLGGGWVLLAGPLVASLLSRRRATLAVSAAAVASVLLWAKAPYTGVDQDTFALAALRYLLPALAACVFALGVAAASGGQRTRTAAACVLAVALGVSLVRDAGLGFPMTPGAGTVVLGLLGGAAAAWAVGASGALRRVRLGAAATGAAILLVAGALTVGSGGYVARHGLTRLFDAGLMAFIVHQPGFGSGREAFAVYPFTASTGAGDHLRHPLPLIRPRAGCPPRADRLLTTGHASALRPLAGCLRGRSVLFDDHTFRVYSRAR
jgi:hypothetical protein